MQKLIVEKESALFEYLRANLSCSKNNIKGMLIRKNILVNNNVETKYDFLLKKGDIITIGNTQIVYNNGSIEIIYEDKDFIVLNKPEGLLTISTEEDYDNKNNLYSIVLKFLKKQNSNSKLFVVHRLDKDTSGLVLFAKKEILMSKLQEDWNDKTERYYYAIVNGKPKKKEVLESYLIEKDNLIYSGKEGKLAITEYELLKSKDNYSLLDIRIRTGRRNQIRVQLKDIGFPIVGDVKYSTGQKKYKRLYLHAYKLVLVNPLTQKKMDFIAKTIDDFYKLI